MKLPNILTLDTENLSLKLDKPFEDSLGNKTCKISYLEDNSKVIFSVKDISLFKKSCLCIESSTTDSQHLLDSLNNLQLRVCEALERDSMEIFNKQFPINKFLLSYNNYVSSSEDNPSTFFVNLTINEQSKVLNLLGDEISSEELLLGNCIIHLDSVTFDKNRFFVNLVLKLFQEVEKEELKTQEEILENETEPEISQEEEESFFA